MDVELKTLEDLEYDVGLHNEGHTNSQLRTAAIKRVKSIQKEELDKGIASAKEYNEMYSCEWSRKYSYPDNNHSRANGAIGSCKRRIKERTKDFIEFFNLIEDDLK